ncbi:hypothetical protein LCS78_24795 [Vibrio harveyi]|nr:hypothetical protein [Vibrio vulnificus]MCU8273748.1 hypothetical protein [Vibrio vulnificus]
MVCGSIGIALLTP